MTLRETLEKIIEDNTIFKVLKEKPSSYVSTKFDKTFSIQLIELSDLEKYEIIFNLKNIKSYKEEETEFRNIINTIKEIVNKYQNSLPYCTYYKFGGADLDSRPDRIAIRLLFSFSIANTINQ